MSSKRFIVIAGNIGSGKTTLTQLLSDHYGWTPYYEVVKENPYLTDFYQDMLRWSLQLQVYFLSKRFQAHQAIARASCSAIQDRSVYEDAHIFARALYEQGKMEKRDFENYLELYHMMTQFLAPPDLVVYIRRSVECLKSRIRERGFAYEQDIPESYLLHLNRCYDEWIADYKFGKVLTVQADNLDLKWKPEDFHYVCSKIESSLEQPELFFTC
ncbi:MAG: deoxynucleoside kinase [Deltaproteobacteria bacterium]|nr:deoxynucleoside kinase [Deltaproteobacteria bacterium]